ncbi:GxxExxY protein [Patescibacteria group bacterium]|nr:GxxExxY protein [Patescibacteria group bacterium]
MEDNGKFLYKKESFDIIDACQEVWKEFGGSFKEKIIDRALEIALKEKGYKIESQKRIDIYFKDQKVGIYIPDKIINGIILLELKCKPFITREDEKQFWHYLKASPYKLGFLINFSPKKLEFRRRVYDMARKAQ